MQRIQKMPHLEVQIAEDDFQNVADVDMKLIELAKRYDAKIITNDFNLNKVATLQGIEILNVNQLANALKPVVLPGETMRVFILREGKEYNQGVAYLDDGTMVVVDGARKMINKTVDITVTSVHQTTAGKMIFGRYDERGEQSRPTIAAVEGHGRSPASAACIPSPAAPSRHSAPLQFSDNPTYLAQGQIGPNGWIVPDASLLRRGLGIAQEDYVGDYVHARDGERLAVGGELKRANLIRREVRQAMPRRAIERLRPDVADRRFRRCCKPRPCRPE